MTASELVDLPRLPIRWPFLLKLRVFFSGFLRSGRPPARNTCHGVLKPACALSADSIPHKRTLADVVVFQASPNIRRLGAVRILPKNLADEMIFVYVFVRCWLGLGLRNDPRNNGGGLILRDSMHNCHGLWLCRKWLGVGVFPLGFHRHGILPASKILASLRYALLVLVGASAAPFAELAGRRCSVHKTALGI